MAGPSTESEVLRRFYSQVEAVIDPVGVAKLLFEEGVLTEDQLDEAELASTPPAEKRAAILSAVRKVVRGNPKTLWVFIAALEKFPGSATVAQKMREALGE